MEQEQNFSEYQESGRNPYELLDSDYPVQDVSPDLEEQSPSDGAPFQESHAETAPAETVEAPTQDSTVASLPTDPAKRVGIHYFPDDDHYNQSDIETWIPVLQTLGVNWITLRAPLDRAIPQEFIQALIDIDIQPLIQMDIPLTEDYRVEDFASTFSAYANWGVRYVSLFDRPNLREQWPGMAWTQKGLVDRFLEKFIPLANAAQQAGLSPVFPGLEPGGDYWDTAFLRASLEALSQRGEAALLSSLVLGAYVWTEDRSLTWGAGGPENWPATMPYHTPKDSEDQRSLHIFDWYNAISRAVLGNELPIIMLAVGVQREETVKRDALMGKRAINITESLARTPSDANNSVAANVLACNFWLLSAPQSHPYFHSAWFKPNNAKPTKIGEEWLAWKYPDTEKKDLPAQPAAPKAAPQAAYTPAPAAPAVNAKGHSLNHYLLLPTATDWPMEAVRSFLQDHQATVGTSAQEAAQATRVTLAGGLQAFSDDVIRSLIQSGCTVDNLQLSVA